jgi:hypothetical protein
MRRYQCVAVIVVAAGGMLAGATTFDNVTQNGIVAQERMQQIAAALAIYEADYNCPIDDPVRLFTLGIITDPLVFWHPGDSNPPPTTIDNSVVDAPNSTQISFTLTTTCPGCLPPGSVLLQDNSSANNDGRFVQYLTNDGYVFTNPPGALPVPTNVVTTWRNLRTLYTACAQYAVEYNGQPPLQLSQLYPSYLVSPRVFWNPGDADPLPTTIDNDVPNAVNSALISFEYPVAGQAWFELPPATIAIADNSPANNEGYGISVVRVDGSIRFIPVGPMGDADRDGDVDLADWARFQVCYTADSPYGILDNACRVLDWDGDNRIDLTDYAEFVPLLTGPQD